jgi:ABC-2 type transport system permease protein
MTLIKHELKKGYKSLAIWTLTIGFFVVICVLMFPEMKGEMEDVSEMFSSMGAFTQAFGMDKLNFGTLMGFYAIECGNILGLGGAFYAAILGITALAKEEKERTAEFLLSHPISRHKIITEKLIAIFIQIITMNVLVFFMSVISIVSINEEILWRELLLLHLSYVLVQIVLTGICFGISAFVRSSGIGAGIGLAITMYFINIVSNITDSVKNLKYITPFGFAEGADIMLNVDLDWNTVAINMFFSLVGVVVAYKKYINKDIR